MEQKDEIAALMALGMSQVKAIKTFYESRNAEPASSSETKSPSQASPGSSVVQGHVERFNNLSLLGCEEKKIAPGRLSLQPTKAPGIFTAPRTSLVSPLHLCPLRSFLRP
jgi:hypothetical protein